MSLSQVVSVDIADVISTLTGQIPENRKMCCPLPIHTENTASFFIFDDNHRFKCFGCGNGGDVIDFVELYLEIKTFDAIQWIASKYNIPIGNNIRDSVSQYDTLKSFVNYYSTKLHLIRKQLEELGFNYDYCLKNKWGYAQKGDNIKGDTDKLIEHGLLVKKGDRTISLFSVESRIIIPINTGPRLSYVVGRALTKKSGIKYIIPNGIKKPILGTINTGDVFCFEGVTDFNIALQMNIKCFGLQGPTDLSAISIPENTKSITMVFDSDKAGESYVLKYGLHFVKYTDVYFYRLPDSMDFRDFTLLKRTLSELERIKFIDFLLSDIGIYKDQIFSLFVHQGEIEKARILKKLAIHFDVSQKSIKDEIGGTLSNNDTILYKDLSYKIPSKYIVGNGILISKGLAVIPISSQIIIPINTGYDESNSKFMLLGFGYTVFDMKEILIPFQSVCNINILITLSDLGLDVRSSNIKAVSDFIMEFHNRNIKLYPGFNVKNTVGWNDGKFVFPDKIVTKDDIMNNVIFSNTSINPKMYKQAGTRNGWINAIDILGSLQDSSTMIFLLWVGFASVLAEPLGYKNLWIHLSGESSTGKTLALKMMGSIWGCSNESKDSIINKMDFTAVGLGRLWSSLNSLPFLLDESGMVDDRVQWQNTIFRFIGGRGRIKANSTVSGTADIKTNSNFLISTGEHGLLGTKFKTGMIPRILRFLGSPFKEVNKKIVTLFKAKITENYGFAGVEFLQYFLKNRDKYSERFFDYDKYLKSINSSKKLSPVEFRLIDNLTPIYIAGLIVKDMFGFEWNVDTTMSTVVDMLINSLSGSVSVGERLFDSLRQYVVSNRSDFVELSDYRTDIEIQAKDKPQLNPESKPKYTYKGFIVSKSGNPCDLIIPVINFESICDELAGINTYKIVLKEWIFKNMLKLETNRDRFRVKIGGINTSVIYVKNFFALEMYNNN